MFDCPHCGKQHDTANHFCPITGQPIPLGERMSGQVLLGKYEIQEFLGPWFAGGTFKVREVSGSGSTYIAKMVHPQFSRNTTELGLYTDTVEKWMNLSHPNVARVLEIGRDDSGVPIIVREHFDGLQLKQVFKDSAALFDLSEAAWILEGVLQGLIVLHDVGVKSGRMTAGDVFLVEGDGGAAEVKVVDFGEYLLESFADDREEKKGDLRLYKAPEQVREATTEFASDIFAAGVILYRLLTGRFPYPDGIPGKPEKVPGFAAVAEINTELPSVIDYNLRRAMAIFPRDRFKGAAQFAQTLKGFIPESPVKYSSIVKRVSIVPEAAVKAQAAKAPVVEKKPRPRMDTIKLDQQVAVPPPEIASATTQQFDASIPAEIKEAIERHSQSPSSPPGALEVPFDARPDAWKEERKLIPRASRPPSKPPAPPAGTPLVYGVTDEAAAPPAPVVLEGQAPGPAKQTVRKPPAPTLKTKPSVVRRKEVEEESLAPIMPARHAKWFIVGGIILGVLLLAWGTKSFFFSGKNGQEGDKKGKAVIVKQEEDAEAGSQQEEDAAASTEEPPAVAQELAVALPDAVTAAVGDVPGGAEQPISILEGLMAAKDAAADEEVEAAAPVEAKPEFVTITLNVTPSKAAVYFDDAKSKKPHKFKVEKSDEMHEARVEYEGYEPWSMSVPAQESKVIDVELQKIEKPTAPEQPKEVKTTKPKVQKTKGKKGGKKGKKKGGLVEDVPF